ncbi:natterin-2-like [Amphiura filiformis]|uniref:natterin-2-like n=1 Tax=Amphiura filiformis TaxID=82378 RepID=UPI003B21C5CE
MKDILVEDQLIDITEPDLLGTCTNTCNRAGLIRSDFRGCQEVRDCHKQRNGWTKGFFRCDHCTCHCINRKLASQYTLTNVEYDLSEAATLEGAPLALAETIVENDANIEQTTTRVLTFTTTQTTTMSSSYSLEMGLMVTVEGTAGVPGVASVSTSVSASITTGFEYTAGSSEKKSISDSLEASIKVPPYSSVIALATGRILKIDVPYSADLVTTYEDGSTQTKQVTGVYTGVETTRFRIQYKDPIAMNGTIARV